MLVEIVRMIARARILPFGEVEKISAWAAACGLARHLDGARLFNAVVASGIAAKE